MITKHDPKDVVAIIHAVVDAQSSRLFKSEVNSVVRSGYVLLAIQYELALALHDAGVCVQEGLIHLVESDAVSDVILDRMLEDGYELHPSLLGGSNV